MASETERIVEVLGGRKLLGRSVKSPMVLMSVVRAGLPYRSLESVGQALQLEWDALSSSIVIPQRTLMRRKAQGKLSADESDRLLRLARVAAKAVDAFGTLEKASRWLQRPNRVLGNQTPLSLMDTDVGVREVEALIGRIEHGVYS